MAEIHRQISNGLTVRLPTGLSHKLIVHDKVPIQFIEIPDIHFNLGSPVVCLDPKEGLIHGLSHVFFFSKQTVDEEMVIVGHADTSGKPEVNYRLSEARALGVRAILTGDEDAWRSVTEKAQVQDFQRTFKSLSTLYYWDCDPKAVDNKAGPATTRAVKGFQKEANSIFDLGLSVDGIMSAETWIGVLKVFRFLLQKGGVDLDHAYPFVSTGSGVYACGESFPVKSKGNKNLVSKENRRVEVYFGPKGQLAPLDPPPSPSVDLTAKECILFDPDSCDIIPFGLKSSLSVKHLDPEGKPQPGVTAKLFDANGQLADAPKVTDANGLVFWFGLPAGDYHVEFSDA